ncbi:MAG TPA: hypothetical protein VJK48_04290 [Chlamydiales bacterium]|nr:hypothetical protein [Chlamydiales bacterium]
MFLSLQNGIRKWGRGCQCQDLALGDTAFIRSDPGKVVSGQKLKAAQALFRELAGTYRNVERPEWGDFVFSVQVVGETPLLMARTFIPDHPSVPLQVISYSLGKVEMTGLDREPPDKLFRFFFEEGQWKMTVSDIVSTDLNLDARVKVF